MSLDPFDKASEIEMLGYIEAIARIAKEAGFKSWQEMCAAAPDMTTMFADLDLVKPSEHTSQREVELAQTANGGSFSLPS